MAQPFTSGTGRALKPHLPLSMLTGSAKVTSRGLRMQQGGAEAGAGHGSDRESRGWVGGWGCISQRQTALRHPQVDDAGETRHGVPGLCS